jgi:hypothetical protein
MVDIRKIAYMLGASIPVVAVGGIIALSKVTDPPNETPHGERPVPLPRLLPLQAGDPCYDGARIFIAHACDLLHTYKEILASKESRDVIKKQATSVLERVASGLETDFKNLYDRVDRIGKEFPEIRNAVKSAYMDEAIKIQAILIRQIIEEIENTNITRRTIAKYLEELSDVLIQHALNGYSECISKSGIP